MTTNPPTTRPHQRPQHTQQRPTEKSGLSPKPRYVTASDTVGASSSDAPSSANYCRRPLRFGPVPCTALRVEHWLRHRRPTFVHVRRFPLRSHCQSLPSPSIVTVRYVRHRPPDFAGYLALRSRTDETRRRAERGRNSRAHSVVACPGRPACSLKDEAVAARDSKRLGLGRGSSCATFPAIGRSVAHILCVHVLERADVARCAVLRPRRGSAWGEDGLAIGAVCSARRW
jgi:hypothetical protein